MATTNGIYTESQLAALEKKKEDDIACGEIETAHPGYLGSQDTFFVGTLKGVGRVYQQTFVDTYSKVAQCKLYTMKTPITAADLLNDRVLPFYSQYEIEHTKTKARHPQTNGICERFHKTILNEFYQVAFRKKVYTMVEQLQEDLDAWVEYYNTQRTHQGKMCCGRTSLRTLEDGKAICKKKQIG